MRVEGNGPLSIFIHAVQANPRIFSSNQDKKVDGTTSLALPHS